MSKITSIHAREILDSRGAPTIEVEVFTDSAYGRAAAPSGASVGIHEAHELRDGDKNRFFKKGVQKAVQLAKGEIADALIGMDVTNQEAIDQKLIELDGTTQKERLGANTILATSISVLRAATCKKNTWLYEFIAPDCQPALPRPMINILNGGAHAGFNMDIQEMMIVPKIYGSYLDAIRMGAEIFHTLKETLIGHHLLSHLVGDEGGFAPAIGSHKEGLDLIMEAIKKAGYKPGEDVELAIDVAASQLYEDGCYRFSIEDRTFETSELIAYYKDLAKSYPLISIEDGMAEDDWNAWVEMTQELGDASLLVGDDLFVTNVERIAQGVEKGAANAVLIKPNQIGTVSETLKAITYAKEQDLKTIISHRSGDTEDYFIADLAVAVGADFIKTGSMNRSERLSKYNQLLRIAERLES